MKHIFSFSTLKGQKNLLKKTKSKMSKTPEVLKEIDLIKVLETLDKLSEILKTIEALEREKTKQVTLKKIGNIYEEALKKYGSLAEKIMNDRSTLIEKTIDFLMKKADYLLALGYYEEFYKILDKLIELTQKPLITTQESEALDKILKTAYLYAKHLEILLEKFDMEKESIYQFDKFISTFNKKRKESKIELPSFLKW